jgi:hypothetical protein
MALIAANRLTVTIPNGPDDPPAEEVARHRITRWLEGEYGYVPPVERLEGHGWSAEWEVGGRTTIGWRYEAVIPRHLGPARDEIARARHPAGTARRSARPKRMPPELADTLATMDRLFAVPETGA